MASNVTFVKPQASANGNWTRYDDAAEFEITGLTGGAAYDVMIANGDDYVVTPTVPSAINEIGPLEYNGGTSDTSHTFTADLSGLTSGDQIVLVSFNEVEADAMTVNGNATGTPVKSGFGFDRRMTYATYTTVGADIGASIPITVTVNPGRDFSGLYILSASGKTLASADFDAGTTAAASLTVGNDDNVIAAIAVGTDQNFDGTTGGTLPTWTAGAGTVAETTNDNTLDGSVNGSSSVNVTGVLVADGATSVSAQGDGSDVVAILGLVFE